MNKIFLKFLRFFTVIAVSVMLSASCRDFLDSEYLFNDRMTTEDIFTNRDYTEQWLARAYSFLSNYYLMDISYKEYLPFNFADDYVFSNFGDYCKILKNGEYNENTWQTVEGMLVTTFDLTHRVWEYAYQGIRHASVFIHNIDMNTEFTVEVRADMKAQARFLRAYFYWCMLRMYGPVPLLPDKGVDYTMNYDELAFPRNTYDECVEFITDELALAAKDLPLRVRDMNNVARITPGAALALRAKVLIYAASPLMNGQEAQRGQTGGPVRDYASEMTDRNGKTELLPLEYDESKWAKAAAAARDVMELGIYELYTVPVRASNPTDLSYPGTITPPFDSEFSDKDWPLGWQDIDPFESYRSFFNGTARVFDNPELIFTRGRNTIVNVQWGMPGTTGGGRYDRSATTMLAAENLPNDVGYNCNGLTQKQVDAYYMNDGTDAPGKDREIGRGDGSVRVSGYTTQDDVDAGLYKPLRTNVSLQYANREPRFYASVAFNGAICNATSVITTYQPMFSDKQVFYYRGSEDGYLNNGTWQFTGIGCNKYVHPTDAYRITPSSDHGGRVEDKYDPAIRYAEILLIYAEALNELEGTYNIPSWNGETTYTIQRNVDEMKKGIRPIRIRGGVPDYSVAVYNNKDMFRAKLKRERQIELLAEGHRYFDLRRWMDADIEEVLPIYGCYTYATAAQRDLFHMPVPVPQIPTSFSKKMWFWPIPHVELRRNKNLSQNPGWTYPDF